MNRENDLKEAQGFAAELRRLRRARRLSLTQLSGLTHYSRGYLSNVENGHKPATAELARRLDEVLRAEGALAGLVAPAEDAPPCPYRGLAAFGFEDARWFFGRERSTAALISRVAECANRDQPLVVFGASGAGKSSLLCAGLVPALAAGALPATGSADWPVLVMTPTAHPTAVLAESVAKLLAVPHENLGDGIRAGRWGAALRTALGPGRGRLVLIVDQFEEVFTLCEKGSERQALIGALCDASRPGEGSEQAAALVVLGVRADFYGRCLAYPELLGAVQDNQFAVGAMSREELVEAIVGPARVAKLDLEPGLVEVLLRDLGIDHGIDQEHATYEPRVLPLLSHALLATWQQRQGSRLTVAGYQLTGGIHGSVAATAERVHTSLDATARQEARRLLLRLVRVGEDSEDSSRRIERNRLISDSADQAASAVALEAFVAARLLTLDCDSAEITHEALLRAWPRLRGWIDTDRAWLLVRQQLTEAAEAWDREGRHPATLYRGPRLATAREWVNEAGSAAGLTPLARQFLDASIQLEHDEQRAVRRRTRRLHKLVAGLTVLFLFAAGATIYAIKAREDVIEQRNLAVSRKVASEANGLRAGDPLLAGQLSLAAYRLAPTVETRSSLLSSWAAPYSTVVTSGADLGKALVLSPDGRTLATTTRDGFSLWDVTDPWQPGDPVTVTGHSKEVVSAAFSPNGRLLATDSMDGTVRLWDVVNRRGPRVLGTIPGYTGSGEAVASVAFAPTDAVLVTVGQDRTARLWDVTDPQQPRALGKTSQHSDAVRVVAFSPQGHTLATVGGDGTVQLWDVADQSSPRHLRPLPVPMEPAAGFSPDGRLLVTAGKDRTIRLWDMTDPRQASMLASLPGHDDRIRALALSRDGRMLATAGDDRTIRLWDVTDPHQPGALAVLTGHTEAVTSLVFSRDGRTLVSASADSTARLWEVPGPVLADHTAAVYAVAFSPDGRVLATTSDDRTLRLRDVSDPRRPSLLAATPTGHTGTVRSVAFSPDGRLLATASWDETVRLWDVADPRRPSLMAIVSGHDAKIRWVVFSPDGRRLATASDDHTVRLWDVRNPRKPTLLSTLTGHSETVRVVAFSPDGSLLATASWDKTARLWNVTNPRKPMPLGTITGYGHQVRSIVFHPNGNVVATATWDGVIRLWNVTDPQRPRLLAPLAEHNGMVFSAVFSADGRTLATTGIDGTVRLWDVTDPQRPNALAVLLTEQPTAVFASAFSPDGHTLATAAHDHTTRLWETDVERVATRVCGTAQNALPEGEWERYFPETPYNPPCS
ncbi:WD40 repeat protein/transcriptional regulator with XRE-family HTH domain [Kibdelosporangium banguiense]|uniref:WD40 repeat protein/transcriptional regulator with XRE-family HTH domain n=1 Tax=Kibdelosporangium banguiense TaxID=1365924 RepID=A0ABS4TW10_9PSEU|nr:helix-turn-helix domain-containing protein [Kibdelosporangium banguiense]MBP2328596.1 WD40 repeat protein/transcriptional regulator with XRE-family HTH domain [Kibdelosporangium banguiense]